MPQIPDFYEPFLEELKDGPLSGIDLMKRVKDKKEHYFTKKNKK
jgi:hypothetical protein